MYTNTLEQLTKFGYFFIIGIILSIVFDIFRVLRRSFKTSDFITNVEDVVLGIVTGIIIILSIFLFNNGELRIYIFIGILTGVIFYMLFFSIHFIKINVGVIIYIKKFFKILTKPLIYLLNILKKMFFKPISFIFINIKGIMIKILKNNIKIIKKNKKTINKEGF